MKINVMITGTIDVPSWRIDGDGDPHPADFKFCNGVCAYNGNLTLDEAISGLAKRLARNPEGLHITMG